MVNKDELTAIYSEFFSATVKNPLVLLERVCNALNLDTEEAREVIKSHLFALNNDELETLSTNPTGFKLLHLYALEKENRMNINQNFKREN